jgi:hypothetical protein
MNRAFTALFRISLRTIDDLISLGSKVLSQPMPQGKLLFSLRMIIGLCLIQGLAETATFLVYLFQSGGLANTIRFLRSDNPVVAGLIILAGFFILAITLAGFRSKNKQAYGFAEFLCGIVSAFALFLLVIRRHDTPIEAEWAVAVIGSFYLTTEGLCLVIDEEYDKQSPRASPPSSGRMITDVHINNPRSPS